MSKMGREVLRRQLKEPREKKHKSFIDTIVKYTVDKVDNKENEENMEQKKDNLAIINIDTGEIIKELKEGDSFRIKEQMVEELDNIVEEIQQLSDRNKILLEEIVSKNKEAVKSKKTSSEIIKGLQKEIKNLIEQLEISTKLNNDLRPKEVIQDEETFEWLAFEGFGDNEKLEIKEEVLKLEVPIKKESFITKLKKKFFKAAPTELTIDEQLKETEKDIKDQEKEFELLSTQKKLRNVAKGKLEAFKLEQTEELEKFISIQKEDLIIQEKVLNELTTKQDKELKELRLVIDQEKKARETTRKEKKTNLKKLTITKEELSKKLKAFNR